MFGRHEKIDPTFLLVYWDSNVVLSREFVNAYTFFDSGSVDNLVILLYSVGNSILDTERRLLHE